MIYAVIDVGSNTMRLSVYRCEEKNVTTLFSNKETVGLAGYIKDGAMSEVGINKACYTLGLFMSTLSNFAIDGVYTFATASLRNINNTIQVLEEIKRSTGIDIDVITGEEEASLDFVGATHSVKITNGLLVDIGGGSTELVDFREGKVLSAVSIPLGSLNTYKQYCTGLIPTEEEQTAIRDAVLRELKKLKQIKKVKYSLLCGVGGTVRATKKINNEVMNILPSNNKILCSNLKKISRELTGNPTVGLDLILRIAPDRLRTIVSGVTILRTVSDYFSGDEILVSGYGVREGYLYSKILGESYGNI